VGLHGLLFAFGWIEGRLPAVPRPPRQSIIVLPPFEGPIAVPMPFTLPSVPQGPAERIRAPRPAPARRSPATPPPVALVQPRVEAPADSAPADSAPPPAPTPGEPGRLAPGLAHGKLWVEPLPLPPTELAQRLSRSPEQLADSAVTATIQAFLDSVALEPGADRAQLPSWTTKVGGQTIGIDGQNIYIAGLKIPAAVLGLLPLGSGGNIDQSKANQRLMDMRADIEQAATRAATLAEFKQGIKEIRERKEREREFARNQRTPPSDQRPPPRDSAAERP
jgi:hypothetical protein